MRRAEIGSFGACAAGCVALGLVCWLSTDGQGLGGVTVRRDAPMPTGAVFAAHYRAYQRAGGPNAVEPENARWTALQQRAEMLATQPRGAGIFPGGWKWLGPGNIGGRLRAIVIHPTTPNTMWIGSAGGGIWKTTNGGASWAPCDDFLPSLAVSTMVIDKTNPNVLYAGTGEGFFETEDGTMNTSAIRGAGIFKTTDGGTTWVQLASTANPDFYQVNRLAIHPTNPLILLAATRSGIWRTTDGGQTWSKKWSGIALDLRFHPTNGNQAVCGTHDVGVLYTLDGGLTWNASSGAVGHRTEVCYAPSSPNIVYATVSNSNTIRIWRSTDGGRTFTQQAASTISTYESYNNCLWVDPTNSNTVIYGGVYMYRTTNGGGSRSQAFSDLHPDMHAIVEHPGFNGTSNRTVFFGTDGGIYRTTDSNGNAVTELNNNLGITQPYGGTMNATTGIALIGNQDNGTTRFSGNPEGWVSMFGGDGGYVAHDPTNPNYFYGEVQWAYVFRSTNGGQSANYIYNTSQPISDAGGSNTNFIPYLMLDPNDPNRMLVCCRRLWRSNNVKASSPSWSAIKGAIGLGPGESIDSKNAHMSPSSPFNLSAVAVAMGNSDIIWTAHNNGEIYKTTNGTATNPTWTRVDDGSGPMPARWVSKIVIDASNHNRVFVAFMGWSDDNVWMTNDGGATWTQITGSGNTKLPAAPVAALAIHPTQPGWIYAGTEIGLFTSEDYGATWTTSTQGPGAVPVEELTWVGSSKLLCVTHGRGVYLATRLLQRTP